MCVFTLPRSCVFYGAKNDGGKDAREAQQCCDAPADVGPADGEASVLGVVDVGFPVVWRDEYPDGRQEEPCQYEEERSRRLWCRRMLASPFFWRFVAFQCAGCMVPGRKEGHAGVRRWSGGRRGWRLLSCRGGCVCRRFAALAERRTRANMDVFPALRAAHDGFFLDVCGVGVPVSAIGACGGEPLGVFSHRWGRVRCGRVCFPAPAGVR